MTTVDSRIERRSRLSGEDVREVLRLVDAVTDADGVRPLSEHVMLHLRYGGDAPARNFLAFRDDELAGYAHLDTTDVVAGASAELAVSPEHRGVGIGRSLVEALVEDTAGGRLRLWSHGGQSGAAALAQ